MPEMVQQCFDKYLSAQNLQAIPLMVEAGGEHQCGRTLSGTQGRDTAGNGPSSFFELVARYVSIVVFNAVVKLATKYRGYRNRHTRKHAALRGKTACSMYTEYGARQLPFDYKT